jgi:hypothetical protein
MEYEIGGSFIPHFTVGNRNEKYNVTILAAIGANVSMK